VQVGLIFQRDEHLSSAKSFRTGFFIESGLKSEGFSCGWGTSFLDFHNAPCISHLKKKPIQIYYDAFTQVGLQLNEIEDKWVEAKYER
jgi:hypothetical protein